MSGWLMNPFRFAAPVVSPDEYTMLLAHFDGANGSTDFVDSAGRHTLTAHGNAQISTAQAKFGQSLLLDGSGDYLSIASSADWNLGNTWTIEFWAKGTASTAMLGWNQVSGHSTRLYMGHDGSKLDCSYIQSSSINWKCRANCAWPTADFNHVALVRDAGSNFKWFLNGVLIPNTDGNGGTWPSLTDLNLLIGAHRNESGLIYVTGNLDELRISKGIARWTENFTPPTAPY